jgi:hypothetical protein
MARVSPGVKWIVSSFFLGCKQDLFWWFQVRPGLHVCMTRVGPTVGQGIKVMFFLLVPLSVFLKPLQVVLGPLLRVQALCVEKLDWRVAPSTKV